MQESRLFKIVYYLMNKGSSTAPELAEKFEVSIRTIYRDIDVISSAGIPIYATQGKGGGIAISEDFILDKSLLSKEEKEQVLMALQGLIATDNNYADELLSKLGSLFQMQNTNWIEVDFSNWVKGNISDDIFDHIKKAIFKKNMIQFHYYGSTDVIERKVAPLKLVFKSKDWYLYAYCMLRNDYRFFKLSRIKNLQVLNEIYPSDITIPKAVTKQIELEKTIPVVLKFDKSMAFRVLDEFRNEVVEDETGDLYVHTSLPDSEVLYSYLFSFSDSVEVIEPETIREGYKKKLRKMLNKY